MLLEECIFNRQSISYIQVSHELPKDYRTLLRTPKIVEIKPAGGGKYWYNGIERNLRLIFSNLEKDISISLKFNMDGLPLFKSSKVTFWPILSTVHSNNLNEISINQVALPRKINFKCNILLFFPK